MAVYDYLIAGAGLYGSVFAREAADAGFRVLVLEKRPQIGGNLYTEEDGSIQIHRYGPHIFHTEDPEVWGYVNRFATFNHYIHMPLANFRGKIFSLPFSMMTFHQMWGVTDPEAAERMIRSQSEGASAGDPSNLEEQAVRTVGRDLYETLVRGYTEKQWGSECAELPPSIIRRIPVRFTYDSRYFSDPYQGIPKDGYTAMIRRMLDGIEVRTGTDYLKDRAAFDAMADRVVFTGPVDMFYGGRFGYLRYRSVRFETERLPRPNFQGCAVVNYTAPEVPWTRIIEHKWFTFGKDTAGREIPDTVISREYSSEWKPGEEAYYPVNDAENDALYRRYAEMAASEPKVRFGGRLGEYRYYNMDQAVRKALDAFGEEMDRRGRKQV